MSGFNQVLIGGYPDGGLVTDRKPLMLPNQAFSNLENAYVWRERTIKRLGTVGMGQLRRIFSAASVGNSGTSPWTFNIFSSVSPALTAPNQQLEPGSVTIVIGTYTFVDQGNGVLAQGGAITGATQANPCHITSTAHHLTTGFTVTIQGVGGMTELNGNTYTITVVDANHFSLNGVNSTGYTAYTSGGTWTSINATNFGTINYATGSVTITSGASSGTASTATFNYYPNLPVMGICKQDISTFGIDQTVFFDTTYAYQFVNGGFQEFTADGTTWTAPNNANGTNTNFFWTCNYQGATPNLRYFFATNDWINPAASTYDPIRYYAPASSTWTALTPLVDSTHYMFQALILIPYYGRLLALNTWEGTAVSPGNCVNYFSRCRFSQIGDPTNNGSTGPYVASSWSSDVFGVGGFLDAPTNEAIVSAAFYRNTLIVFFEYSTWQLRYIGEYGLPFIFERISSDFGATSTFSPIVFDQGVMAVSERGIIEAGAGGVKRLDDQIPETVFSFEIQDNGPDFVHGVRDFEKELIYYNYLDAESSQMFQNWPDTVLLFNYKNNTWAQFRDTITCFGVGQFQLGITWDSQTTLWDDNGVDWDNSDDQQYSDYILAGNPCGYISIYENQEVEGLVNSATNYAPSLAISDVNLSVTPVTLTVPNHNLANYEIIYVSGAIWNAADPGINNTIFQVMPIDVNTISLAKWNGMNYVAVTASSTPTYLGGGYVTLLPKMNIVGKDFSPYQEKGKGFKVSYIDFQMDSSSSFPGIPATTIQLFVNGYLGEQANLVTASTSPDQEVLNTSQKVGIISGVQKTNPCIITSYNHSLQPGAMINIGNILGTTQLNGNTSPYVITVIDLNTFSLNGIDATGFTTYISGGTWWTQPMNGQSYIPGSQYAWYRFYSTQFGQYLRVGLTYDDTLMNQLSTHNSIMELNAMNFWFRPGGRLVN